MSTGMLKAALRIRLEIENYGYLARLMGKDPKGGPLSPPSPESSTGRDQAQQVSVGCMIWGRIGVYLPPGDSVALP
jgi:hypothetical protein